jgi:hypothetical protein
MNNVSRTIHLKGYNPDNGRTEETGETLSTYVLARSMTLENFTSLFDNYLNLGGKGQREGKEVGLLLRYSHRTLQRLAICFALGIVAGLSEQDFTDPRNETAIETAKKIARMLDDESLPLGWYI